ncbi:hypothetical protein [Planosporangium mesophilum]|uniref:Uncharacterized protein n=1 Tax=Planosporangium mesophilum TaxID=689768 RepID=A0A8J3T6F5_9ACTN|nr:hypothetical protein [Planosporangium mesophilum]GII21088.1 hypothetical protein Pme01_06850 [Planosporangium mesophilum]
MTEQRSPWARPPAGAHDPANPDDPAGGVAYPPAPTAQTPAEPAARTPAEPAARTPAAPPRRPGYRAGTVTGLTRTPAPLAVPPADPAGDRDPARRNRSMLWWFGGTAIAVVAVGVVVVLAMVMTGGGSPFDRRPAGPSDTRPDLAKLCPPPSHDAPGGPPAAPPPPGPRTDDAASGISYASYGEPWLPWHDTWTKGTLRVSYQTGQYFVTESYQDPLGFRSQYLASILSGSVPAANNDSLSLDLECTGRQVAADVRAEYYPQPNQMDVLRDEQTTLGGRPAWVTTFRMRFHQAGLKATDELVGVALVDVGRPRAAILYVSIPGTHRQYDWVVDSVLDSVRPVG